MKAHNFLFDFIPKELLYIINNNLKYDLELTSAPGMQCMSDGNVMKLLAC
jgi:hypothetical protein